MSEQLRLPKIVYARKITNTKYPFFPEINQHKAAEILTYAGVPQTEIASMILVVKDLSFRDQGKRLLSKLTRREFHPKHHALTEPSGHKMVIYAGTRLRSYSEAKRYATLVVKILEGNAESSKGITSMTRNERRRRRIMKIGNFFPGYSVGPEVTNILKNDSTPERVPRAVALLRKSQEEELSETIAHEAIHAGSILQYSEAAKQSIRKRFTRKIRQTELIVIADAILSTLIYNVTSYQDSITHMLEHNNLATVLTFIGGLGLACFNLLRPSRLRGKNYQNDPLEIEVNQMLPLINKDVLKGMVTINEVPGTSRRLR